MPFFNPHPRPNSVFSAWTSVENQTAKLFQQKCSQVVKNKELLLEKIAVFLVSL